MLLEETIDTDEKVYAIEDLKSAIDGIMNIFEFYDIDRVSDLRDLAPMSPFMVGNFGRLEIKSSNYGSGSLVQAAIVSYYLNGDTKSIIEAGVGNSSYPGYFVFKCRERVGNKDYSLMVNYKSKNFHHERVLGSVHPHGLKFALEELLSKLE